MVTAPLWLIKFWKPIAAVVVVLAVWGALAWWGHTKYEAGVAWQKAEDKKVFDEIARLTEVTKSAVSQREVEIAGLLASSNKAREEGIAHAVEEQQRIVADVRSGALRLRQQWAGCPAANAAPKDGSATPDPDGGAALRATDSGSLVRAGDDADVQVRGLQDYARACQKALEPLKVK